VVARHRPEGFARLIDEDVAEAARAVAATLETAMRGVLYEHNPTSATGQRLARELTAFLTELRSQGAKVYDGEAAIALRAVERAARDVHRSATQDDAYISLMARLLRTSSLQRPDDDAAEAKRAGTVILP
jgi:formylmethanofuran dehydrogenase subunit B